MPIRMEVASSRPDHLPTQSAAKTSNFLCSSDRLFGGGVADAGNAAPTFCFSVSAYHIDSGIAMDFADINSETPHLGD